MSTEKYGVRVVEDPVRFPGPESGPTSTAGLGRVRVALFQATGGRWIAASMPHDDAEVKRP